MNRRLIAVVYCLALGLALVSSVGSAQDVPAEEGGLAAEDTSSATAEVSADSSAGSEQTGSRRPGAIRDLSEHTRPYGISAMAYVPWYYGVGIGVNVRFEIPIVPDGFISAINDQVSLEPSMGLGYRRYGIGGFSDDLTFFDITPALYGMWSFHITPKFRPYAAFGLGYDIAIWLNEDDVVGTGARTSYFYWDTAVGLFYNFSESVAFRGELGSQGPKAGLSIFF